MLATWREASDLPNMAYKRERCICARIQGVKSLRRYEKMTAVASRLIRPIHHNQLKDKQKVHDID